MRARSLFAVLLAASILPAARTALADPSTTITAYDLSNNAVVETLNPTGNVTNTIYDSADHLTIETTQNGTDSATFNEYSNNGTILQSFTETGVIYNAVYDNTNHRSYVSTPAVVPGQTTTVSYNNIGNFNGTLIVTPVTITRYTYDDPDHDLFLSLTTNAGNSQTFERNTITGNQVAIINTPGSVTATTYDPVDHQLLVNTEDTLGNPTIYVYNSANTLVKTEIPLGKPTTYTYDSLDHELISGGTDPSGNPVIYKYDANFNLVGTIIPLGTVNEISYDSTDGPDGRLIVATIPATATTPEPTTLTLLSLTILPFLTRRRR